LSAVDGLAHRIRPAAAEPEGALVLLHGRATDENDLFPLIDLLDPRARLVAATVGGPLSLPPGGRHWYAVRAIGYPDPGTFHPTYAALTAWVDAFLAENGLAHDRLVMGGFSQGTVMSWAVSLGAGRPRPAGTIGLSGFMPTVDDEFSLDLEDLTGFRAAIGHGAADPVIGVEWGRDARDRLVAAGADVVYEEHPGGHHIDPRFLGTLPEWLSRTLN
jgi:phospholipase/carboxylesterase